MNRFRTKLLTAAAMAMAVSFVGGTTAWASATVAPHGSGRPILTGTGFGTGALPIVAEQNAFTDLRNNYSGCINITLVSDAESASGPWSAEVQGTCQLAL
jgi:hypothetical protein